MRTGLLLISLGLLGFFGHSVCARAIDSDDDKLTIEEILTEVFRDEAQETVEPSAENDNVDPEFEKILQEIFGDAVQEQGNPKAERNLDDAELEEILKEVFGDPTQTRYELRPRRGVDPQEEAVEWYYGENPDENESSETSLPVSAEEEKFDWQGDLDKVEIY